MESPAAMRLVANGGLRQPIQRPPGVNSPPRSPMGQPLTIKQVYTPGIRLGMGT